MNFYYQNGDFMLQNNEPWEVLIQILGIVATISAAYLGAYFAIRAQKNWEKDQALARSINRFRFLRSLLVRTINSIESQISSISTYGRALIQFPTLQHELSLIPLDDLDRISNALKEEFSYVSYNNSMPKTELNEEDFNQLVWNLDFFKNSLSSLIADIKETAKDDNLKKEIFLKEFNEFKEEIIKVLSQHRKQITPNLDKLRELFYSKPSFDTENLNKLKSEYILPLTSMVQSISNENNGNYNFIMLLGIRCQERIWEISELSKKYGVAIVEKEVQFNLIISRLKNQYIEMANIK